MTSETATLLNETAERLFSDHVTRDVLAAAEEGEWPQGLWTALEENGLTQPLAPEAHGGLGIDWTDVFVIVFAAGKHRAPVPLPETMAAGWLLGRAGADVPAGPLTLAAADDLAEDGANLTGSVAEVPWARNSERLVCCVNGQIHLVSLEGSTITPDANMAAEPRDLVTLDSAEATALGALNLTGGISPARALGALMRSAQMAGAAERAIELAVAHAQDRQQFGRPIAKFQAIQQALSIAAARAAEARVAAEAAFTAMDRVGDDGSGWEAALWDIAAAKVVCGEAAGIVYDTCHQVHGAIGFTYEHELHFATRRLWAWRGEFGSETDWAEYLGGRVLMDGADALWPNLTAAQAAG